MTLTRFEGDAGASSNSMQIVHVSLGAGCRGEYVSGMTEAASHRDRVGRMAILEIVDNLIVEVCGLVWWSSVLQ